MDKLVALLESLAKGLRDLMTLGLLEREEVEGHLRLDVLAKDDPDTIWRGSAVAALLVGIIFTLTMPLAKGGEATFEVGTKLHGAVPPLLLGLLVAVVVFIILFSWIVERLTWRQPRRWLLLGIWAASIAPASLGLAIGYTLISMSGRIDPGKDPTLVGTEVGTGVALCVIAVTWGLLRAAVATRRYLQGLMCMRHHDATCCPFWCRAWYGAVAWAFPLSVFAGIVLLLTR